MHSGYCLQRSPPFTACWVPPIPCEISRRVRTAHAVRAPLTSLPSVARQESSKQIVWSSSANTKYIPFKPEFFSSEPVELAGSWNNWSFNIPLTHDPTLGEACHVLQIDASQPDYLTFKYFVNGKWHLSRADAAAADEQGCVNNTITGRKLVRFSLPAPFAGPRLDDAEQEVHLVGSFTAWQVLIPMTLEADGEYHCTVALPPGRHVFKFLQLNPLPQRRAMYQAARAQQSLDKGRYYLHPTLPRETLPSGIEVNYLHVPPPPIFRVLYHTHCSEAYIHYRLAGYEESFRCARMYHTCTGLMTAYINSPAPDTSLEFIIQGTTSNGDSNGDGSSNGSSNHNGSTSGWQQQGSDWMHNRGSRASTSQPERDPPDGQPYYTASRPGTWRLKQGRLRLDEASQLHPLMLCTDLDGTLIEDQAEENDWIRRNDDATYSASLHFHQYVAPAGGLLVYNTGRSIGMVEGLLAKKKGVMPWPTAVITAVGTKIFLWDVAKNKWTADPAYEQLLDEGWNLNEVRQQAKKLLNRFNGAASVIDDGSEHPHRMSLQIQQHVLNDLVSQWSQGLMEAGVQHQMVASIGGDWRYVDCIAINAGKGRAMAYLAARFGIALEDVVAAGDSGNDLLMLGRLTEGNHPAIVMSNSHPEVWDWLARCSPEERSWIYTPKAERAAGLVEGLKAIIADKLAAQHARQLQEQQLLLQQQQPPLHLPGQPGTVRALRG